MATHDGSIRLVGCDAGLLDQDEEYMMGIDEAGRGPTIGPMVYGSAFCKVSDEHKLKAMGFADSKTLTEDQRDELWAGVQSCGFIGWAIRVLHANEISNGMLRRPAPYNLNAMSHDAAIGLVQQVLDMGVNLRHLYVDTVGNEETYQAKLQRIFPTLNVTVRSKADSLFPVVSAASICAKVPRDTLLREWRFEDPRLGCDKNWGCGYPSDPLTKSWLKENMHPLFGFPNVVRFSWGPVVDILEKNHKMHGAIEVQWPAEEVSADVQQQQNFMAGFTGRGKEAKPKHHHLFEACGLETVSSW
tara:strand:+ start:1568 stop:2470 length:903 start_codon:yes stop_codon:yes gene_type:complete